jgi:transposase
MPRTAIEYDAENLPQDVETLRALVVELLEALEHEHRHVERLEHRLQNLLRQRFGPSAEKVSRDQLLLFAREILQDPEAEPKPADEIVVKEHLRNGRRGLPADLPRIRIEHDVPEDEKCCPDCGQMRTVFGEEISEQLEYEPAKMHVIEHVRLKYVCKACEGNIVVADKPRQPIEKCLAGPGLLAQVIVNKYGDHQPLHRLEKILKRNGVDLKRSTMCDWMAGCAAALRPLQERMRQLVRSSAVIHTDDTPVPVQEKGRGRTRQGRFWVYVGDHDHRYAVFDYTPDRAASGPRGWLKGYDGYLQADAYAGYQELYATGKVLEVACWAHARRKFYDARMANPGVCLQALAWIKRLYAIEREARERALDVEQCYMLRQERAAPLLGQFRQWLDAQDVLPKSPAAAAIEYVRSRWDAFTRYTTDGILSIDNNPAENSLRRVALGRKNWLFAGSEKGGHTAATLFSLIASAALHELDPYLWLRDALARIADIPLSRLDHLLPDRWQAGR